MTVWLAAAPVMLAAVAVLYLPGVVLGSALHLDTRITIVLAPPVSVALIAGSGVIAGLAGRHWSPAWPVVTLAALVIVVLSIRIASHRRTIDIQAMQDCARHLRRDVATRALSWALGSVIGILLTMRLIGTPDALSQTYDAVFHLNAVRWIEDTGNASSFRFSMTAPSGAIYPLGWHTVTYLVLAMSHAPSIMTAANAVDIIVAGPVWTAGCLLMVDQLTDGRRTALTATTVLAFSAPAFPSLPLVYGALFPNFLATAMLPGVIAAVAWCAGVWKRPVRPTQTVIVTGVAVGGLCLAHPNTAVLVFITVAILAWRSVVIVLSGGSPLRSPRSATLLSRAVGWTIVVITVTQTLRPTKGASGWPPLTSTAGAVGEALLAAPHTTQVPWALAGLALLGCTALVRRRTGGWLITLHLLIMAIYVAATAFRDTGLRYTLTGLWYSDSPRIGEFLPVAAVPFAAVGATALLDRLRRLPLPLALRRCTTVTVVSLTAVLGLMCGPTTLRAADRGRTAYTMTDTSVSVSTNEYRLMRVLPSIVPQGDVVAVDPWTGAALAYAVSGTRVSTRHVQEQPSHDGMVVRDLLNQAASDPRVCASLDEKQIRYALAFDGPLIHNGPAYPGFADLSTAPGFDLVAKQGDAALYKITACG